jgi:hypothetical protein
VFAPHRTATAYGFISSRWILQQFLDHPLGLDGIAAAEQVGVIEQVVEVIDGNPAKMVAG